MPLVFLTYIPQIVHQMDIRHKKRQKKVFYRIIKKTFFSRKVFLGNLMPYASNLLILASG